MNKNSPDIVTVVGARPQFIKAAIVSRALIKNDLCESIVHTGQHFDDKMSQAFFDELSLKEPVQNLALSKLPPGEFHARAVEMLSSIFSNMKPKLVLVYGDTDSTLAGAIAAVKSGVPLAHVEAGLRSGNRRMAEERNRVITDAASDIAYCPTENSFQQLSSEHFAGRAIFSGDVMLDAVCQSGIQLGQSGRTQPFILATIHRAENVDDPVVLNEILLALGTAKTEIILPLHPRTRKSIEKFSISVPGNITQIEPLGYHEMIAHITDAVMVATDSGGVQKEAYFCGTPAIIFRNETEWTELLEIGASKIAGTSHGLIIKCIEETLGRENPTLSCFSGPFGNGNAGTIIAEDIARFITDQV